MSKQLSIELQIYPSCNLSLAVKLLRKASLDIRDSEGNIHILNRESYDFETFKYSDKEFVALPQDTWFKAFGKEIKEVQVYIKDGNCLCVYVNAYINRVLLSENEPVPDFNMYYDCLVNRMDKEHSLIERVVFEEF